MKNSPKLMLRYLFLPFLMMLGGADMGVFSAQAAEVQLVRVETIGSNTRAQIHWQGNNSQYKTFTLNNPLRFVVDIPKSSARRGLILPVGAGVVKSVRTGKPDANTLRVVFDLSKNAAASKPRIENNKLIIEWPRTVENSPLNLAAPKPSNIALTNRPQVPTTITTTTTQAPAATASRPAASSMLATATNTPATSPSITVPTTIAIATPPRAPTATGRHLIVAIDPGHGGKDPGAIGPTGKKEKDANLAIARELARQVNATVGLKAYLTRDSDIFIPLNERAQLARNARADIFISLHADAAENRSARGSSVYILSLKGASSQRARWLADKENAADLIGGISLTQTDNTLTSVLLDLAQSGHMKASEDAGNQILAGLKRIGNNHKPNIEKANFAVLRTADMPSMLVETAFISNRDEEANLFSSAHQRKVAQAILDGVKTYFTRQPPPGTMFAQRATATDKK